MKKYELTEKHRALLPAWRDKYIANALKTGLMSEAEKERMREAVEGLYRAANLRPPPRHRIVFVPSPFLLRFAAGFAAAIWQRSATRAATYAATNAATRAATDDATYAATNAATRAATNAATYAATYDATRAATDDATYAATNAATRAATDDATSDATSDATRAATNDATNAATRAATDDATSDATSDATRAATNDATNAATRAATDDATSDATSDATRAATNDATDDATHAATNDATDDATHAATNDAWFHFDTDGVVAAGKLLKIGADEWNYTQDIYSAWNGGNQWSGWVAYISFFRVIAKLTIDYKHWLPYETLAEAGPRVVHQNFCMISERPVELHLNAQQQPHCETGPFCKWNDGSALYALNGVRMPKSLVETPAEKISPVRVLQENNVDIRRELIRKIGIERMLAQLPHKTMSVRGNYELLSVKLSDGVPDARYLKMVNPSIGCFHLEGVAAECSTVEQALNWRNSSWFTDAEALT